MQASIFLLQAPQFVFADDTSPQHDPINEASENLTLAVTPTGVPTGTIGEVVGSLIKGALTAVGSIFLLLMLYAGILWMTARGEEEQATKAKDLIKAAMIGLVITVSAYAVTAFITSKLT